MKLGPSFHPVQLPRVPANRQPCGNGYKTLFFVADVLAIKLERLFLASFFRLVKHLIVEFVSQLSNIRLGNFFRTDRLVPQLCLLFGQVACPCC
jgi:hypothetical protein